MDSVEHIRNIARKVLKAQGWSDANQLFTPGNFPSLGFQRDRVHLRRKIVREAREFSPNEIAFALGVKIQDIKNDIRISEQGDFCKNKITELLEWVRDMGSTLRAEQHAAKHQEDADFRHILAEKENVSRLCEEKLKQAATLACVKHPNYVHFQRELERCLIYKLFHNFFIEAQIQDLKEEEE